MHRRSTTRVLGILGPQAAGAEPSELIRAAMDLGDRGADIVDLDTRTGGAFAGCDDDTLALAVRGMSEAGIPVSVTTTRAATAAIAIERGASWIIDPSGATADPEMLAVAARPSTVGWIIGPWSDRASLAAETESRASAYTYGLVRNLSCLLAVGVDSNRLLMNASAGLSSAASDRWRMLGDLDRIRALGYPVLIDACEDVLRSMATDESGRRLDDAAVGLAVLAAGARVWGIRTQAVERVSATLDRILEPRRIA